METGKIVSNAKEAVIKMGSINVDKLIINGQFASNISFPILDSVEVGPEGEIEFTKERQIPKLKTIKNSGKLKITTEVFSLEFIETEPSSYFYLESTSNSKIKNLTNIKGFADINIQLSSLKELEVSSGAKINLMSQSMLLLNSIIVREDAQLIIRDESISRINSISVYNFGEIKFLAKDYIFKSIYNGPKAKLTLFYHTVVEGKEIKDEDLSLFNIENFPNEEKIWVFNEGTITVMPQESGPTFIKDIKKNIILSLPNEIEDEELSSTKVKGLMFYNNGKYVGTETAVLGLDVFASLCFRNMKNEGKIYCPQKMFIKQIGNIERYGTIVSENGIDMDTNKPLLLDGTIQPIINDDTKMMNINCYEYTEVTNKNCIFADLHLNTKSFYCNGILSTKSLILTCNDFLINKSENGVKNVVSSNDKFEINTNLFKNDGGILQSLSKKRIKNQSRFSIYKHRRRRIFKRPSKHQMVLK